MKYLFYCRARSEVATAHVALADGYRMYWWQPRLFRVLPPGRTANWSSLARWVLVAGLRSHQYRVICIASPSGETIHASGICSRYFRFPFMEPDDLQIIGVWTDSRYRNRGLASHAVTAAVRETSAPRGRCWYITTADNSASLRVAQRAGFAEFGEGRRTEGAFPGWLTRYELDQV